MMMIISVVRIIVLLIYVAVHGSFYRDVTPLPSGIDFLFGPEGLVLGWNILMECGEASKCIFRWNGRIITELPLRMDTVAMMYLTWMMYYNRRKSIWGGYLDGREKPNYNKASQ